jgi:hypothetical protein
MKLRKRALPKRALATGGALLLGLVLVLVSQGSPVLADLQDTPVAPTVTGTPAGITALVLQVDEPQINVRSGPNTLCASYGFVLPGETVTVQGRSTAGDWILIDYVGAPQGSGWVFSRYLQIKPGGLTIPVVNVDANRPCPESMPTPTVDPTLAAQFITTPIPTRLPTFTPAAPLQVPTYATAGGSSAGGWVPMGLVIVVIAGIGLLLWIFSLLSPR